MTRIFILLPVHNRKEITRAFVVCLRRQTCTDYHLLLIDDGSSDGTAEMVSEMIPAATVLRGDGSLWWAGSLQLGLDWLKKNGAENDDIVLFMNDDVLVDSDYLSNAVRVMEGRKGVLVASQFQSSDGRPPVETGVVADFRTGTFRDAELSGEINCLPTRGLFLHWEDVKRIGGFHPRLLPHYGSDYEYTFRAYRKGLRCETSSEILVLPNETTTGFHSYQEATFGSFLKKYFSKRSSSNPFYRSVLVMLVCKHIWIVRSLVIVWAVAAKTIGEALIRSFMARNGRR